MAESSLVKRVVRTLDSLARKALLFGVLGLALAVPPAVFTVEYTARNEYCNSCHIMEPYYESWENSSHADVACIECHYEPGALETFTGKFKALSQLAKYITRTEGTKPWAEVSDQSCMRSGCHAVPMLEGPIAFGDVKFDHRHHLLESRRGRRLRCTSCHSQIVQGEHVSVTPSVCYMCHFMPDEHGMVPEDTSDCLMCHGPPTEPVMVAGRPFDHTEYNARGVRCTECHDPVLKGDGAVRKERCHSCHAEVGHIERYGETAFLHEMHVTDHKVECFECHDEIQHGLLPLEPVQAGGNEGCASCHFDPHDANQLLYAGTGAVGVPDRPSRMYHTRVVCSSCHTGRRGFLTDGGIVPPEDHVHGKGSEIAAAGEVDCIHCHGTGFAGMLEGWQTVVQEELDRLEPLVAELGERLDGDEAHPARPLYEEAWRNVHLVVRDGSAGAHNPLYALDALRAGDERIAAAYALLDPTAAPPAAAAPPFVSAAGCSECHLGIERTAPIEVHARPFSHANHVLEAGLDCAACHATETEEHGAPAFPRTDCGSCHHQETEGRDPWDCAACHKGQEDFIYGEVGDFEPLSGPMEAKECDTCHGEPPDILTPNANLCAVCHDDEHADTLATWRQTTEELMAQLTVAIAAGEREGVAAEILDPARRARDAVAADGSGGAHNFPLTERLLLDALEALR